jgi:hypothetical protein
MDDSSKTFPRITGRITEVVARYTVTVWYRKGPTIAEAQLITDEAVPSIDAAQAIIQRTADAHSIQNHDVDIDISMHTLKEYGKTKH